MSRGIRVPSPMWVLLPGALLALLGGRAVVSEFQRARDAARTRAGAAAARLARAAENLIAESAEPLPAWGNAVTSERADAALRHLQPRWATTREGRFVPLLSGDDVTDGDKALVEDALENVTKLRKESGPAAAAALAAAAAEGAAGSWARSRLRVMAARTDAESGDPASALRLLGAVVAEPPHAVDPPTYAAPGRRSEDEWVYVPALVLALDLLTAEGAPRTPAPEWLLAAHRNVLRDPWGLDSDTRRELLARITGLLDDDLARTAREVAERWQQVRDGQRSDGRHGGPRVRVGMQRPPTERNELTRHVWVQSLAKVRIGGRVEDLWLGGEIPAFVERLESEAAALSAETDIAAVALFAPRGRVLIASDDYAWPEPGGPEDDLRQAVRLRLEPGAQERHEPLSGWRAEAVAAAPRGIPSNAALLGAAVLVTTLALGWGAFALRRATRDYARLAEERRTFLDHVAHEIRTPSSALLALSEELDSGHVGADRRDEYDGHLLRESRRLARLVEETLDLTRLESGRLAARRERTDLRGVVREAVAAAGEGVHLGLPSGALEADVDSGALRRSVRNLVENALRYGGAEQRPEVTLSADGEQAFIVVRDLGPGIDPEHHDRIFERFYRVPSETHEVKGVGLGLALCRTVARAHGGDVTVASTPGSGATFTLRVPCVETTR